MREWEKLCNECSDIVNKAGITKEDTDRIIKETREMQNKANKYDSLVKKIEDKIIKYQSEMEVDKTNLNVFNANNIRQEVITNLQELLGGRDIK